MLSRILSLSVHGTGHSKLPVFWFGTFKSHQLRKRVNKSVYTGAAVELSVHWVTLMISVLTESFKVILDR